MSDKRIETINPATGKVIATYDIMGNDERFPRKLIMHTSFQKNWKSLDISERSTYIRALGRVMRKNKDEYARLITEEMGKPVRQAIAEIEKCAWLCDYYSEHSESFLRDELIPTEFREKLCIIRATRSNCRYHAVEFSLLAGNEICCSCSYDW